MKSYKILLLIIPVLLFTFSCTEEHVYTPGEPEDDTYGVYFPEGQTVFRLMPQDKRELTIPVARANSKEKYPAITIHLDADHFQEWTKVVSVSDIQFGQGETETTCTLSFDSAAPNVRYLCHLQIPDEYASNYNAGATFRDVFITIEKWWKLGSAQFYDELCFATNDNCVEALNIQDSLELYQKIVPRSDGQDGLALTWKLMYPYSNREILSMVLGDSVLVEDKEFLKNYLVDKNCRLINDYPRELVFYANNEQDVDEDGNLILHFDFIDPGVQSDTSNAQLLYVPSDYPSLDPDAKKSAGHSYFNRTDSVWYLNPVATVWIDGNPLMEVKTDGENENTVIVGSPATVVIGMYKVDLGDIILGK